MKYIAYIFIIGFLFVSCEEAEVISPNTYNCNLSYPDQSNSHPLKNELQAALDELAPYTPGVQVAIRTADGNSWTSASGMADIPNNIPFEACHKTMIGSISKTFTAVLILQLQDEGILDIDDPLSNWFEQEVLDEIENANEVSIRQLLDHTSGIRDYLSTQQFINSLNTPYFQETQEEKLAYVFGKSAYHAPGEKFTYSNTNYVLLGLIVEKARQIPLWDALEMHIFNPLGMENAEMGTHDQPIPSGTARPYLLRGKNKYHDIIHLAVSDAATGDGGIASNMQDINVFIERLFEGGLLSEESFKQMRDDRIEVGEDEADFPQWPGESYGLGMSLFKTPYGDAYGHTGSTSTYNAFLFYFPEKNVTVSYGYNGDANSEGWDRRRVFRERLFELLLK